MWRDELPRSIWVVLHLQSPRTLRKTVSVRTLEEAQRERGTSSLLIGTLVFRWVWLVWMTALAIAERAALVRPLLAWSAVAIAAVWTLWLTLVRPDWDWKVGAADVIVSGWLVLVSGLVVAPGEVVSGRPFFATGYPLSAALAAGATGGPALGVGAGGVLASLHLLSRPINGVGLNELSASQVQNVTGAMLNYLVAGGAVGIVWRWLNRSEEAVRVATEAVVREREYSARLSERESLARAIHDSVLQTLALVHKRGRELAAERQVPREDVAKLADLAARQEAELRALILRAPDAAPYGRTSLRDALEDAARSVEGVNVTVSALGPLWLDASSAEEIAGAAKQALENVARHAKARRATVFAEQDDSHVVVSVRDDGVGFDYDENDLRARGKVGILKSMKGRIEDLGGRMRIESAPGGGTEVEFRVPLDTDTS